MASKKFLELQEYSLDDLRSDIQVRERDYLKLSFDHSVKGLENPMQLREMRRDIARLHSELRRRELADAPESVIANRSKIRARRRKK